MLKQKLIQSAHLELVPVIDNDDDDGSKTSVLIN